MQSIFNRGRELSNNAREEGNPFSTSGYEFWLPGLKACDGPDQQAKGFRYLCFR